MSAMRLALKLFGKRGSKNLRYGILCFVLNPVQMILVAEAFSVDLLNVFSSGRPCSKPAHFGLDLDSAEGLAIARRRYSRRATGSPASSLMLSWSGPTFLRAFFWCAVAGTSIRS
jgi:hypothetical protein